MQQSTTTRTVKFNIYPEQEGIKVWAKALIEGDELKSVKLMTKVPRGQYYSFLNDAGLVAEKLLSAGDL
jgi:hypothetical protein